MHWFLLELFMISINFYHKKYFLWEQSSGKDHTHLHSTDLQIYCRLKARWVLVDSAECVRHPVLCHSLLLPVNFQLHGLTVPCERAASGHDVWGVFTEFSTPQQQSHPQTHPARPCLSVCLSFCLSVCMSLALTETHTHRVNQYTSVVNQYTHTHKKNRDFTWM